MALPLFACTKEKTGCPAAKSRAKTRGTACEGPAFMRVYSFDTTCIRHRGPRRDMISL